MSAPNLFSVFQLDFFGIELTDVQVWLDPFLKLDQVVKQVQLLSSRFFSIILSEGIKSFQKEDSSTLGISAHLNKIVGEVPIDGLIQELESHVAFLGKMSPSHCFSSSNLTSLGTFPTHGFSQSSWTCVQS